ncbi:MAG: aspartate aminotransferase family protein [Dehalococcoidia bacterium]|nr:aspartate aminotransferase family protein [Dehalococcoidia bacterium]
MKLEKESLGILREALDRMEEGFAGLPDAEVHYDADALRGVLLEVADRMKDNYPYFHPCYAGQMLKPPHPVARLAYMLSMWVNPNNHALDGGKASSHMEKEAVADIARMFGWESYLGHLSSGGTMANLEALWVSGKLNPGKKLLASEQAHYTHSRITEVLHIPFESVPCDNRSRMDMGALEDRLKKGDVGTVVATIGSTGTGAVDPLSAILDLREKYGFRLHADSAYGGYYVLADNLTPETAASYKRLGEADSIVIDPHKHGLQPYGCGCILFRDPSVGTLYKHDSPYTYFSSSELHLGEISLECSRAGASAVALWATQRLLPMTRGGEFARGLMKCRDAALDLYRRLEAEPLFLTMFPPELDIVIWAPKATRSSEISRLSQELFDKAATNDLHLALFSYPSKLLKDAWPDVTFEADTVACLRSCLMKPDHADWTDHIWEALKGTMQAISR